MAALPPFQALLDAHGAAVWRFLRASLGEHDAADCYQDTVLSALRAYPSLRRADNLKSWFFTIAHHTAIDHHRRVARRREADGDRFDAAELVVVAGPEPGDEDLWAAVAQLPPKQQAAIVHRYVSDLAYAEIAVILECSEAAARQNVRAGLAALRGRLEKELQP
jgi:RNA polymerase sigma factor (sigma-70 family)